MNYTSIKKIKKSINLHFYILAANNWKMVFLIRAPKKHERLSGKKIWI